MKARPALVARVNDGTGAFPRIPVMIRRRAIAFPIERKDGKLFHPPDVIGFYARYNLDGKAHIDALGKHAGPAYARFLQIESDVARMRQGLDPIHKPEPDPKDQRSLSVWIQVFKASLKTLGKRKSTIAAYTRTLDDFSSQFPHKTVDEITREDLLAHIDHLRDTVKRRSHGDPQRTFRNRLSYVCIFFNSLGLKCPLPLREMKKGMKSKPTKYSIDAINLMLKHAKLNEKDLILFFLHTGFRDEEVAYAKWTDIDFVKGSINVYAKPEYDWKPKDSEFRQQDIVLQEKFLKRMQARRERWHDFSPLIFPTNRGTPCMHLIKTVQRVCKRAGIVDKRITLHAFRRTFGTLVAKEYGLEQARIWLGHADLQTTQAYIAADEFSTEQSREKVKNMFSGVGD